MPKRSPVAAAFVATLSLVVGAVAGCSTFSEEDGPTTDGPDAGAAESSLPEGEIAETEPPAGHDGSGADSGLDCTDRGLLICDGFERSVPFAGPWSTEVEVGGGVLATADQPLFHGRSLSASLGATAGIESSAALVLTLKSVGRQPTLRARFSFYLPVPGTTAAPRAPVTLAKIVLGDSPDDGGVTPGNVSVICDPVTGPSLFLVDNLGLKGERQLVTAGEWYDAVFSVSGAAPMSTATLLVTPHMGGEPTNGVIMSPQSTVNGPRAVTLGIAIDGSDPHYGGELSIDDVVISSY